MFRDYEIKSLTWCIPQPMCASISLGTTRLWNFKKSSANRSVEQRLFCVTTTGVTSYRKQMSATFRAELPLRKSGRKLNWMAWCRRRRRRPSHATRIAILGLGPAQAFSTPEIGALVPDLSMRCETLTSFSIANRDGPNRHSICLQDVV